jgi:hypothetical protein
VTAQLERRYGRLLGVYPPAFRDRYGPEMLAALLHTADVGRKWPSARETAAILGGGIRQRALQQVGDPSARGALRSGLLLGAFLGLGVQMAMCLQRWNHDWTAQVAPITDEPQSQLMVWVWATALIAAVTQTQSARRVAVAATSVLAVGTWLYTVWPKSTLYYPSNWAVEIIPLATGLLLPAALLSWQRDDIGEHRRSSLLVALAGPAMVGLAIGITPESLTDAIALPAYFLLVGVAVLLAVADPRLAVATAVAILPLALVQVGHAVFPRQDIDVGAAGLAGFIAFVSPFALVGAFSWLGLRLWSKATTT